MYNSVFRSEIEDQAHRKWLDTFMGPNAIASAMLGVTRNYFYTLACRVSMDLLIPITRLGTIKTFQTLTFAILKKQTFAEGFLHTRFFRQLFETGLDYAVFAVFWIATKYKNKYVDPPPDPATTTTAAPPTGRPTNRPRKRISYDSNLPYNYELNYDPSDSNYPYNTKTKSHLTLDQNVAIENIFESAEDNRHDTFYHQYIQPHSQPSFDNSWQGIKSKNNQRVNKRGGVLSYSK